VVASALLFLQLPIPPTYFGRTIENAGHTPLFFLVTLAVIYALRDHPRCAGARLYLVAFLAGSGLGLLSEVIQRPLRRDASWEDVFADVIGTLCALAVYALFERRSGLRRWHRVSSLLVAAVCLAIYIAPILNMTRAYLHRNGQFPVIASFDSRIEMAWIMSFGVHREIIDGVLHVDFFGVDLPGISFYEPFPDWLVYQTLQIDLENPGAEILDLGVRVHDNHHNWQFNDRFNRKFKIGAGERRVLRFGLDEIRNGPRTRPLDMEEISDISLFRNEKTGSRQLLIHRIWLE
jgi:VanZ family protein